MTQDNIQTNSPELWINDFSFREGDSNKYDYGHAVVMGGGRETTGAARLAAVSALRAGAGLVTVATPDDALPIYANSLVSVMTRMVDSAYDLKNLLEDDRKNAFLIGPGHGLTDLTKTFSLNILQAKKFTILDADAITIFQDNPESLYSALHSNVVLTPHEGEFKRIFDINGDKITRCSEAAKLCGSVVLLKGEDTIIASPDGSIVVNENAPPWLATAGSGDVLAGIILGLIARHIPPFQAACAAVWIHAEIAKEIGLGLIAEDLPNALPTVLQTLYDLKKQR